MDYKSGIQWLHGKVNFQPIYWVFLLAFGIRLYACLTTYIVNPDGIQYIYQARAIYFQDWHHITTCQISYISPLPFLIALMYALVHDWVIAARTITLLFSFASLIPLYFICIRFFNRSISTMAILVFAMIPAFVGRSADVIRDPIFWPFLTLGLFFYVRHWDEDRIHRPNFTLFWSCFFFILATWTRLEGVMYLSLATVYLLVACKNSRLKSTFIFLSPVLLMIGLGLLIVMLADIPMNQFLRFERLKSEFLQPFKNYQSLDAAVGLLIENSSGHIHEFLRRTQEGIWLVPIGALIICILEKFFYPYVLIWLWGFGNCAWLLRKRPANFFLASTFVALIVLYLHLINTWMIFDRFLSILILPGILFVANGCKNIISYMQSKFKIQKSTAFILLAAFIIVFGLGKNLRPRYEEKGIFTQIGATIRQHKVPGQVARIAAPSNGDYERVFFYANLDWPGAPCDKAYIGKIHQDYSEFVATLKEEGIRYVLYSDDDWPKKQIDLLNLNYEEDFKIIGKWLYEDSENFYLLTLKNE